RREARGAEEARRVGARIVVAPDLGATRAHPAAQVEDGVEARARAAGFDGRRARDRRRPLEDLLGRGTRAAAAAGQLTRAARRAAEGSSLDRDHGRVATRPRPRERGRRRGGRGRRVCGGGRGRGGRRPRRGGGGRRRGGRGRRRRGGRRAGGRRRRGHEGGQHHVPVVVQAQGQTPL